jgi:hypothetical protein
VTAFIDTIKDLQRARDTDRAQRSTESEKRLIGCWVIVLRLFHPAILPNLGEGRDSRARKVSQRLSAWHEGNYTECFLTPLQQYTIPEAKPKSSKQEGDAQKRRATQKFVLGQISRQVQAVEAGGVMPGTQEVQDEIVNLNPQVLVPLDCPRRERLQKKIEERREGWRIFAAFAFDDCILYIQLRQDHDEAWGHTWSTYNVAHRSIPVDSLLELAATNDHPLSFGPPRWWSHLTEESFVCHLNARTST